MYCHLETPVLTPSGSKSILIGKSAPTMDPIIFSWNRKGCKRFSLLLLLFIPFLTKGPIMERRKYTETLKFKV